MLDSAARRAIRRRVLAYFDRAQRDLPWRRRRDAYAIWVSEIMLQQTRVATVIPYFERWMDRFPTLLDLARADEGEVLALWSGLGYYSRARNLHRGAREVAERYHGKLPDTATELVKLPGIGRYTAGAIASQAFGEAAPIVDGNVARLFARLFAIDDDIKGSRGQARIWELAAELVPRDHPGDFNQGLMELGATICTPRKPSCESCPLEDRCQARALGRVAELPVVKPRVAADDKPLLDHHAIWVTRPGHVLLARRRSEGLYGGLWELPQAPGMPEVGAAIGRDLELDADSPLWVHQQELSHRRLRITIWPAKTRGRARAVPPTSPYEQVRFHPSGELSECGLSSATREIINQISKDKTWTSATKPSSSSNRATTRS